MRKVYLAVILVLLLLLGVATYIYAQNFLDTKPTMQFSIPRNFGLLVTLYPQGGNTVMWFESEDGTLRRVMMSSSTGEFDLNVWAITRQ